MIILLDLHHTLFCIFIWCFGPCNELKIVLVTLIWILFTFVCNPFRKVSFLRRIFSLINIKFYWCEFRNNYLWGRKYSGIYPYLVNVAATGVRCVVGTCDEGVNTLPVVSTGGVCPSRLRSRPCPPTPASRYTISLFYYVLCTTAQVWLRAPTTTPSLLV